MLPISDFIGFYEHNGGLSGVQESTMAVAQFHYLLKFSWDPSSVALSSFQTEYLQKSCFQFVACLVPLRRWLVDWPLPVQFSSRCVETEWRIVRSWTPILGVPHNSRRERQAYRQNCWMECWRSFNWLRFDLEDSGIQLSSCWPVTAFQNSIADLNCFVKNQGF